MATGVSVLLGLVLFLHQRTQAQDGVPSIWAEPGSLVLHGSAVTIVCRIPPRVTQLRLYHVETKLWCDRDPQGAPEVAQFSLQQVKPNQAGTYHCEYWTEGRSSGHSDPLGLVVTGMHKEKPSLTAEPGPQVASGGQVTLLCHTTYSYEIFILCRDRAASLPQNCSHQNHSSFLMSPVTLAHRGTYRCYVSSRDRPRLWSLPSNPLELLVTGVPSIWAEPGPLVLHGSAVTIVCRIPPRVTQLRLYHVETKLWCDRDPQGAPEVAQFSLQQVTPNQAGTYHCEYRTEGRSSGQSDPLELVVTGEEEPRTLSPATYSAAHLAGPGMHKEKPSLTAEPGPQVASGGQVTLLCHTDSSYDFFILCRDRAASLPQTCSHQNHSSFLMSPVTLAHGGTYRCYFSSRDRPGLWSLPSDPLELLVTGPPSPLVVGVSAAAAVLLVLCLLLLGLCLCRHRGPRRARFGVTDGGTKSPVWDVSSSPASNVQGEDEEDTEHREHGQPDTQVHAAEGPQEVTYVQLHPRTLTRSVGPLPSRAPQDGSTQPCVYATLTSP
ncbi:leukocyte immunoglobulin-like receptor subfamily A member 3 [Urocitellus parryii]